MTSETHYDVIIVGARCAGAGLAIRLANAALNILLVDRATFPSRPNVPSAPFIHSGTMRLLDELGIQERDYAQPGSRIERFVADFVNGVVAEMAIVDSDLPCAYFYGIDRAHFDHALWRCASNCPTVTALDGFAVTHIQREASGRVAGIRGKSSAAEASFTADLVVGADGRFSFCARQFGAAVIEAKNAHTAAAYTAEFTNVDDYSPQVPHAVTTYNTGKGLMILMIPIGERAYHIGVVTQTRNAAFGVQGHERAYMDSLRGIPHLWNRLRHAQRMTEVVGIRRVENGYRQSWGSGWALVGDAVHYKDPSDGQGIYDALLGSKLLAQSIITWKHHGAAWEVAGAHYQQVLKEATYPMFLQTVANVRQNLYTPMPDFLFRIVAGGLMNNATFKAQFLRYLAREIEPGAFQRVVKTLPFIMAKDAILGPLRRSKD
jgi:2-polyprenyl-6-methoxyphenol hydroxylase-like FAD-dependent oxidoreductase